MEDNESYFPFFSWRKEREGIALKQKEKTFAKSIDIFLKYDIIHLFGKIYSEGCGNDE